MNYDPDVSIDGYEALSEISDAVIAAVHADMVRDPRDTLRIFKELSAVNSDVSMAIFSEARQAADAKKGAELAFIEGATYVLRMLVKQGKAHKLHSMLYPTAHETDKVDTPAKPLKTIRRG